MEEQTSRPCPLVPVCQLQTRLCVARLPEQHHLGGSIDRKLQPDDDDIDAPDEKLSASKEAKVPPAEMDGGEDNDGKCKIEILSKIRRLPVAIVGQT